SAAQPAAPTPSLGVTTETPVSLPSAGMETPIAGITRINDDAISIEGAASESLLGLESTQLGDDASRRSRADMGSLLDLEPTAFGEPPTPPESSSVATPSTGEDLGGDLDFIMPPAAPTPKAGTPAIDFDSSDL